MTPEYLMWKAACAWHDAGWTAKTFSPDYWLGLAHRFVALLDEGREIRTPRRGHLLPVEVLPISEEPDRNSIVAVIYSRRVGPGREELHFRLIGERGAFSTRAGARGETSWPPGRLGFADLKKDDEEWFLGNPPRTFLGRLQWLLRKRPAGPPKVVWYEPIGWFALPAMRLEFCGKCKKAWWVFGSRAEELPPGIVAVCDECARRTRPEMYEETKGETS